MFLYSLMENYPNFEINLYIYTILLYFVVKQQKVNGFFFAGAGAEGTLEELPV